MRGCRHANILAEGHKMSEVVRSPFQLWRAGQGPKAKPSYVYVASSWRNNLQPLVVKRLYDHGIECYDFRNPPGRTGFSWSSIDPNWKNWNTQDWKRALATEEAQAGFNSDFMGMSRADCCVLVLPAGRSAHLEAGYMAAQGKPVFTYAPNKEEPDLMTLLLGPPSNLCWEMTALLQLLGVD